MHLPSIRFLSLLLLANLCCEAARAQPKARPLLPLGWLHLSDSISSWHKRPPDVRIGASVRAWLTNDEKRLFVVVETDDRDNVLAPNTDRLTEFDSLSLSFDSQFPFGFNDLDVGRAGGHNCQIISSWFNNIGEDQNPVGIISLFERDPKRGRTLYRVSIPFQSRFPFRADTEFGLRLQVFDRDKKGFRSLTSSLSSDKTTWSRFRVAPAPATLR